MARALFKSWFVDFDPVRAKLDGRQPVGLDPATAALFPASFQDSDLGQIPKGWVAGSVSDLCTFSRSSINPGDFSDEIFDHYSLPAFDEAQMPKQEPGNGIMSNKFLVAGDAVLLSKLNPHIPRIWMPNLRLDRRSICSTEFIVACPKVDISREYLFSIFTSSGFTSTYGTLITGTTGSHQRVKPENVLGMKIAFPLLAIVKAFTVLAAPLFAQVHHNREQSRTLAALRDTLSPRLLSGELSVAEGAAK